MFSEIFIEWFWLCPKENTFIFNSTNLNEVHIAVKVTVIVGWVVFSRWEVDWLSSKTIYYSFICSSGLPVIKLCLSAFVSHALSYVVHLTADIRGEQTAKPHILIYTNLMTV